MSPTSLRRALAGLALGAALSTAAPASAKGRAKVTWSTVEVQAPTPSAAALERALRPLLAKASKKADFGERKEVELRAHLVEWSSVTTGDVHRVTCTIVGRLVGGPRAKSRISFGGAPKDKAKLEKEILQMVANGVVTRLAAIAREEDRLRAKQKAKAAAAKS